jgi:hypothetical protein
MMAVVDAGPALNRDFEALTANLCKTTELAASVFTWHRCRAPAAAQLGH